jgi:hypothetical protein
MADQRQVEENYTPLRVPKTTVGRHWGVLQDKLGEVLPQVGGKYFIESSAIGGAVGDLRCGDFPGEKAYRERGINVPVVPLLEANSEVRYWLSLHQEWREDLAPGSKRLVYHATGLTVFFGDTASPDKLQLFRAEWAGVRTQSRGIFIFEAPGAGHPHWQFDAYESRAGEVEEERKRLEGFVRALDEITQVEEFSESLVEELSPQSTLNRNVCMQRLSRAHFASCANWSQFPWTGDESQTRAHAQGPADVSEIQNWIVSTVVYLTKELAR